MNRTLPLVLALTAAALALVAFVRPLPARAAAEPTSNSGIAVIDVEKVFNALVERNDMQQQLQAYLTQLNDELKKLDGEAKAAFETARALPDGAEKNSAVQKAIEMQATAQARKQVFEALADRRQSESFRQLFAKISIGGRKIAETRGLNLVIATDENVSVPVGASSTDVQRVISLKRIVYASPTLDITDALIQLLNSEYTKK
ncbi:MAG: OmpH family outer membrane protein [Phycisphaeraceae bacterium]|nr:OmpH family outer membrane protein [Phycisphaeraceae bacterium]